MRTKKHVNQLKINSFLAVKYMLKLMFIQIVFNLNSDNGSKTTLKIGLDVLKEHFHEFTFLYFRIKTHWKTIITYKDDDQTKSTTNAVLIPEKRVIQTTIRSKYIYFYTL